MTSKKFVPNSLSDSYRKRLLALSCDTIQLKTVSEFIAKADKIQEALFLCLKITELLKLPMQAESLS